MSVRLENLNQLHAAARRLKGVAAFQLNSAAASCETIAQQLAPVDTGFMRDHIKQTETAADESLRATVESEAEYSLFVEFGTVRQASQPFMTPAFESAKQQLGRLRGIF